jgi:formylglycine-generating enzyme required for sulfatase activity
MQQEDLNMFWKNLFKKIKGKEIREELIREINDSMVIVPEGSFLMGSNDGEDDERPVHNVLIDSFYMSKYVITQKQWYEVMETKPWLGIKYVCEMDRCPVVNVSWYDARNFIDALNKAADKKFRLPTEAEWEYCCRAGNSNAFAFGVLKINLPKYAWYYENAFKRGEMYAHEVGTRKPNKWGLYDMQGNVYEWCSDWYRRNYYNKSPISNPPGPIYSEYKSVRGGDWARNEYFLRIASRRQYSPHHKDSYVSFRLAMDIEKSGDMEGQNA